MAGANGAAGQPSFLIWQVLMEQQGSSVSSAPIADISEMTADVLEHLHTMAPDSLVEVSQPTRRVIPPTSPSHPLTRVGCLR